MNGRTLPVSRDPSIVSTGSKRSHAQSIHGGAPLLGDHNFARKLAMVEIELKALEYTDLRTLAAVATGKAPGPESSILKIKGTEVQQSLDALFVEAAGYYALPYVPEQYVIDFPDEDPYRPRRRNKIIAALFQ